MCRPPSEKLSGVTLRIAITCGASKRMRCRLLRLSKLPVVVSCVGLALLTLNPAGSFLLCWQGNQPGIEQLLFKSCSWWGVQLTFDENLAAFLNAAISHHVGADFLGHVTPPWRKRTHPVQAGQPMVR